MKKSRNILFKILDSSFIMLIQDDTFILNRTRARGTKYLAYLAWFGDIFHFPHVFCSQVVLWVRIREPFTLNFDPWNFDGHTFCGRGDPTFSICHVDLGDHVKEVPYELIGVSLWSSVNTLPSFLISFLIGLVEEDIEFF